MTLRRRDVLVFLWTSWHRVRHTHTQASGAVHPCALRSKTRWLSQSCLGHTHTHTHTYSNVMTDQIYTTGLDWERTRTWDVQVQQCYMSLRCPQGFSADKRIIFGESLSSFFFFCLLCTTTTMFNSVMNPLIFWHIRGHCAIKKILQVSELKTFSLV